MAEHRHFARIDPEIAAKAEKAAAHGGELLLPKRPQRRVMEDVGDGAGAVSGRHRDQGTADPLHLPLHAGALVRVDAAREETADPLAIKAERLGAGDMKSAVSGESGSVRRAIAGGGTI